MLPSTLHRYLPSAPDWQEPQHLGAPPTVLEWLLDEGSLTQRLQQLGVFAVLPQQEKHSLATTTECRLLALQQDKNIWLRDVVLTLDNVPVVLARTVLPLTSLTGANASLGNMANRSLGGELFQPPIAQREQLWGTQLTTTNPLGPLWGRQSRFIKRNAPLLVAEYFLADFWTHFAP